MKKATNQTGRPGFERKGTVWDRVTRAQTLMDSDKLKRSKTGGDELKKGAGSVNTLCDFERSLLQGGTHPGNGKKSDKAGVPKNESVEH